MLIADFVLQNGIMAFYFIYYYTQQPFINEPARKAYLAFLTLYITVTVSPRLLLLLFDNINSSFWGDSKCLNLFRRLFMMTISLIQGEYLFIVFFSSFDSMTYNYRDALAPSLIFIRLAQVFLQMTLLTILGINEVTTEIKTITVALCGAQMGFNFLFAFMIGNR